MTEADWAAVADIYSAAVAARGATFETSAPLWEAFLHARLPAHMLVAELDGGIAGWATLSPVSGRPCYAGVVEDAVYVAEEARHRGVGRTLLASLVTGARRDGLWTIQAAMFPENAASVALHEAAGFRLVGYRERIAQLDGVWRDTILLELRL